MQSNAEEAQDKAEQAANVLNSRLSKASEDNIKVAQELASAKQANSTYAQEVASASEQVLRLQKRTEEQEKDAAHSAASEPLSTD